MNEGFSSSQEAPLDALTGHGGVWAPEQEHLRFPSILQQLLPHCKGWRCQGKDGAAGRRGQQVRIQKGQLKQ